MIKGTSAFALESEIVKVFQKRAGTSGLTPAQGMETQRTSGCALKAKSKHFCLKEAACFFSLLRADF